MRDSFETTDGTRGATGAATPDQPAGATPPFRRLLMLQGPVGPFFWLLARRLRHQGVEVHKVNLNGGDALFFPGPGAHYWRGKPADWTAYIADLVDRLQIDAIALFGDCRPHHREAITFAGGRGIPVFVFEEGYLRPDHVTVELGGVNGYSPLMATKEIPSVDDARAPVRVGNSFPKMALWSALYLIATDAARILFWHYCHHRGNCTGEGLAYLRGMLRKFRHAGSDRQRVEKAVRSERPYFLLPLQVHFDSQITEHSGFLSVHDMLAAVLLSFARHAPLDARLLVKHHPLDRGHSDYTRFIGQYARKLGCADRILYFTEGHLPTLLDRATGTVTCNSTVGLQSLWHGTPVKVLGNAIYDRPGLTAQKGLDEFWSAPGKVDREQLAAFSAFLRQTCLANGSFYARYRATGLLDGVIARMVDQYVHAHRSRDSLQTVRPPTMTPKTRRERSDGPILPPLLPGIAQGAE